MSFFAWPCCLVADQLVGALVLTTAFVIHWVGRHARINASEALHRTKQASIRTAC